jgi:hypothetical protein
MSYLMIGLPQPVAASESDLPNLQSEEWMQMFGDATHIDVSEDDEPEAIIDDYIIQSDCHRDAVSQAIEIAQPPTPLPTTPPPVEVPIDESTSIVAPASHNSPEQFAPWSSPMTMPVPERRESETREQASPAQVGSPHALSEHHPVEYVPENPTKTAPQIEQEAEQQTTSPRREIQATEPATLPTRWSTRNAPKQACFGYNGTQGGRYVAQAIGAPYAELDKKLASDVNEIKEATLVQGFFNTVYCHLGFTAPTIYKASMKDPNIISYDEAITNTDKKRRVEKGNGTRDSTVGGSISDAKTKILPLTWVLHCKQSPDGEIKKLKACICVQGDLQEGDYVTFTPVIS